LKGKILRTDIKFITVITVFIGILYFLSLSVPLFGDSLGYGYQTTRWIRDNGFTPIAAGSEKGQQAMGHPTLFFWLWALLSGLFGESLAVARLLPLLATFFSVYGMYRLGKLLSCTEAGWISAFALLFSPLFIVQALRPMPESAVVAAVIWSLFYYAKKNYLKASLFATLAVIFREQAVFLVAAYILAELLLDGVRYPKRLILLFSPLLVIPVTGLINLFANGYFFFPTYMGESGQLETGWLAIRTRLFGTHLISEDYRWFPVIVALAGMIRGLGRDKDRRLLPFILILTLPMVFFPPERIFFLIFVTIILAAYAIRERLVFGKLFVVFVTLPVSIVLFHVLIVLVSPDSALNLFRYVLPAYPVIIIGAIVMLFRYYPKKIAIAIGIIYVTATAIANKSQHYDYQLDTSLACVRPLLDYKEAALYAISLGDTILVSGIDCDYFLGAESGVISSGLPVPTRNILNSTSLLSAGTCYTLIIPSFMLAEGNKNIATELIPRGSELILLREPQWNSGNYNINIYRVEPVQ